MNICHVHFVDYSSCSIKVFDYTSGKQKWSFCVGIHTEWLS